MLYLRRCAPSLAVLAFVALVGCAARRPPAGLQRALDALAQRARPGVFGVSVVELATGTAWRVHAERGYPMMSVFKAPLAATVLARVDRGELSLEQSVTLRREDLRDGRSGIRDRFQGEEMAFTVLELLAAVVSLSDNTAADALVRLVGGPQVVTSFLRTHGIEGMRVDRDEAGIGRDTANLDAAGLAAYLRDPRDTSTPDAAIAFLRELWRGALLSRASTRMLIDSMYAQEIPRRLRDGLPAEVRLAHKSGTSNTFGTVTAAYNDIGILTWPDGRTFLVAAFLTASPASQAERDALFAELARAIVRHRDETR